MENDFDKDFDKKETLQQPDPQPAYSQPAQPAYSQPDPQPAYSQPDPQPAYSQPAQPYVQQMTYVPVQMLKTNRGILKFVLLGIVTLGIYPIVLLSSISNDINTIAGRYDGRKTMHFCLLTFIVAPITLGIGSLVWYHNISSRIGAELSRRAVNYSFGAGTFWGWGILGSIILIGPFIYYHKLFTAMNKLSESYNAMGI